MSGRWTAVAFAIAAFAITLLQSVAFFRLAGHSFPERAAFGYSLSLDAAIRADIMRPPVYPGTVAGYLQLRAFDPLAILFAAWAIVEATASTSRQVVSRAAAFAISVVAATVAACVGVLVGVESGGESVSGLRLVEAGLLIVALPIAYFAICLVVARFASAPTLVAAGLLLTLFFLNSLSRVFTQLAVLKWVSPFRYFDLSTPLPAGGNFDVGGFAVLVAIAVVGTAAAAVIPSRNAAAVAGARRATFEASRMRLLAAPVVRVLYPQRIALVAWGVAFVALGVVFVVAARTSMRDLLAVPSGLPGLRQYIFTFYAGVLDETWYATALLLLAALVLVFVWRWSVDDRAGRLEAELSAPYSRSALLLERLAAVGVTSAVLAALGGVAVGVSSRVASLSLDTTRLVEACGLLFLFVLVLGAVGLLLTSSLSGAASMLFGFVLLAALLDDQIGKALGWPLWVQEISPFRLAGAPLGNGVDGRSVTLLLLITLAVFGSSILAFRRHDVGGWSPTKSSQART